MTNNNVIVLEDWRREKARERSGWAFAEYINDCVTPLEDWQKRFVEQVLVAGKHVVVCRPPEDQGL